MSDVAEVLRQARALVDTPEKWMKGWFTNGQGAYCTTGAIKEAMRPQLTGPVANTPAYEALRQAADAPRYSVAMWNDAPERTHAEVLAAFDKAIAHAEANRA